MLFINIAPSTAPGGLTIIATSPRTIVIRWSVLADEEWNGNSIGFKIEIIEAESGSTRLRTVGNRAATSTTISSLKPYYTYHCRLAAFNSVGTGPYVNNSITLPQDGESRYRYIYILYIIYIYIYILYYIYIILYILYIIYIYIYYIIYIIYKLDFPITLTIKQLRV